MERRVAFIGTHNWRVHEAVRSWSAAYGQADRAVAKAAAAAGNAPSGQLDVFGVGRESLENRRSMVWQGLRPGADVRVASRQDVNAVVCSGHGPNDVRIVKDCRRAGKAVFVESLERFQPGDIAELAAGSRVGTAEPALMTGLYLRFDSVLQEAAQLGIERVVGRPLLYQAHASTVTPSLAGHGSVGPLKDLHDAVSPSLFELGMEQVDVLRFLLKTEATEVYAAGSLAPGQQEGASEAGLSAYEAVSMTIKTSSGVVAIVSLDARGGSSPRQHISVVGDTNRASFTGEVSAADLQAVSALVLPRWGGKGTVGSRGFCMAIRDGRKGKGGRVGVCVQREGDCRSAGDERMLCEGRENLCGGPPHRLGGSLEDSCGYAPAVSFQLHASYPKFWSVSKYTKTVPQTPVPHHRICLQAGINHFLDVAAEGAPARLAAADCLAAAAIMAAAQQSLRTSAPVAVCYDWSAAAASAAAATETENGTERGMPAGATASVRLAASSAGAKLGSAACSLMEGAKHLLQGAGSYVEQKQKGADMSGGGSGASTPVDRGSGDEEEVSTPPHHHGTPTLKSIGTPESPPLVSAHPN